MPAKVKSGLYVQSPPALRRRDQAVRRLVYKMRQVMPWLEESDIPACRAWAEIEILASRAYMVLKKDQIVNKKGEPHRLLRDFRQLLQAQLSYATALGMTPAARMMIKASRDNGALDVAQLASQIENDAEDVQTTETEASPTNTNGSES